MNRRHRATSSGGVESGNEGNSESRSLLPHFTLPLLTFIRVKRGVERECSESDTREKRGWAGGTGMGREARKRLETEPIPDHTRPLTSHVVSYAPSDRREERA